MSEAVAPGIPKAINDRAAAFKGRALREKSGRRRRHDKIKPDEVEAIADAFETYGLSKEQVARAFTRDPRQVAKVYQDWKKAKLDRNLRDVTLIARQRDMELHQRHLRAAARCLMSEVREARGDPPDWADRDRCRPLSWSMEDRRELVILQEHVPGSPVWPLIEGLRSGLAERRGLEASVFEEIVAESESRTGLKVIEGLLEKGLVVPGLSRRFARTIFEGAEAAFSEVLPNGLTYSTQPLAEFAVVRWGANPLAQVHPSTAEDVATIHAKLRQDFGMRDEIQRIVQLRDRTTGLVEQAVKAIELVLAAGFTQSTCSICRPWI